MPFPDPPLLPPKRVSHSLVIMQITLATIKIFLVLVLEELPLEHQFSETT